MPPTTVQAILTKNESFRFSSNPGKFLKDDSGKDLSEEERLNMIEANNRANAGHEADFEPPIYNVWKQQEKTAGDLLPTVGLSVFNAEIGKPCTLQGFFTRWPTV